MEALCYLLFLRLQLCSSLPSIVLLLTFASIEWCGQCCWYVIRITRNIFVYIYSLPELAWEKQTWFWGSRLSELSSEQWCPWPWPPSPSQLWTAAVVLTPDSGSQRETRDWRDNAESSYTITLYILSYKTSESVITGGSVLWGINTKPPRMSWVHNMNTSDSLRCPCISLILSVSCSL